MRKDYPIEEMLSWILKMKFKCLTKLRYFGTLSH